MLDSASATVAPIDPLDTPSPDLQGYESGTVLAVPRFARQPPIELPLTILLLDSLFAPQLPLSTDRIPHLPSCLEQSKNESAALMPQGFLRPRAEYLSLPICRNMQRT